MNERPTPETDAEIDSELTSACYPNEYVDAQFARKLERERDAAREERDIARLEVEEISNDLKDARTQIWRLEKQIEGLNNFANERYAEIQSVRKERDEARETIRKVIEIFDAYMEAAK